jgi:hypothetical protein
VFTLSYDRRHNVLMARFSGVFSSQDIAELDQAVIAFTAREGPVHGLIDFSELEAVTVPLSKLLQRGQQPPISPGHKRVMVVPGPQGREFASTFADQQVAAGSGGITIVSTLEEAYRLLHLPREARFEPVD